MAAITTADEAVEEVDVAEVDLIVGFDGQDELFSIKDYIWFWACRFVLYLAR